MKSLLIGILLMVSFLSCRQKDEKLFYKIEGTWNLDRLSYVDSLGGLNETDTICSLITFVNCKDDADQPSSHCKLTQVYGSESIDTEYFISVNDKLNIISSPPNHNPITYPIFILGKSNVYDVLDQSKKELILQIETEYFPVTLERISDLTFYFSKD